MSASKPKVPQKQQHTKQWLAVIDQYVAETGSNHYDMKDVAAWAIIKKLVGIPHVDAIRITANKLKRAARQDYIEDQNGEPVRVRHSVRKKVNGKQMSFWFKMEDATREEMAMSSQDRRRQALADVFQIERDNNYFNEHYNPGEPLQMSFNFDLEIAERYMPDEYPEAPPEQS